LLADCRRFAAAGLVTHDVDWHQPRLAASCWSAASSSSRRGSTPAVPPALPLLVRSLASFLRSQLALHPAHLGPNMLALLARVNRVRLLLLLSPLLLDMGKDQSR